MKLKNYLYKKFSLNLSSNGGRNRMGRITLPHRDLNVHYEENLLI